MSKKRRLLALTEEIGDDCRRSDTGIIRYNYTLANGIPHADFEELLQSLWPISNPDYDPDW